MIELLFGLIAVMWKVFVVDMWPGSLVVFVVGAVALLILFGENQNLSRSERIAGNMVKNGVPPRAAYGSWYIKDGISSFVVSMITIGILVLVGHYFGYLPW